MLLMMIGGCDQIKRPDRSVRVIKNDPLKAHHYVLKNGLQVYITVNREKPVFRAEIAVRAGSKNDPADATGIAHYLEHMLFKGSGRIGTLDYKKEKILLDRITKLYEVYNRTTTPAQRRRIFRKISTLSAQAARYAVPNELDKIYSRIGATGLNAHTGTEETAYMVTVPANHLETWAKVESERFANPVFRLFNTELETVFEEKNRSLDNKDRYFWKEFIKQVYKSHPYGQQNTLGKVEHLRNPSLKKMYAFFRKYYVPNNMAIIISGDVDPGKTIRIIRKHFGKLKARRIEPSRIRKEKPFNGEEKIKVQFRGEEKVLLAFRTVPYYHRDRPALEMLDMILDNSQAGLINLNLNQAQLVRRAGCWPGMYNDHGCQFFYGLPRKGQSLEEVRTLILKQIEKVKRGEFPAWLMRAILTDFIKSRKLKMEKNANRSQELRTGFIRRQSRAQMLDFIPSLKRVTKADVVRVANKYFGKNCLVGYRINGKPVIDKVIKPDFRKIKINSNRRSRFFNELFASPVSGLRPRYINFKNDFTKTVVQKDIHLYTVKNPVNNLFSLSIVLDTGRYNDPLLPFVSRMLSVSGTGKRSAGFIKSMFYRYGCSFRVSPGLRETTILLEGLEENFDRALGLLFELLKGFQPETGTLQRMIRVILARRMAYKSNLRSVSGALYLYGRYGKNSPFIRILPDRKLAAITTQQLKRSLKQLLSYRCRINYFGVRSSKRIASSVRQYFSGEKRKLTLNPEFPKAVRYKEPTILFLHRPMRQAKIYLGIPGALFDRRRKAANSLYNEYLSGSMGSILFQEMREARALAYSVWAGILQGDDTRMEDYFLGVIGTQADKAVEAIWLFRKLIFSTPLSAKRFSITRHSLVNYLLSHRINSRNRLETVQRWEREGFQNTDPRKPVLKQLRNSTLEMIRNTAHRITSGKKIVISLIGDKTRIDMKGLARFGKIQFVTTEDIFGY